MNNYLKHYIGGEWVASEGGSTKIVINPATEEPVSEVVMGTAADVDKAVKVAREAFKSFSQTTREERIALLKRISEEYGKRMGGIAQAITEEMGCPISTSSTAQAGSGMGHIGSTIAALEAFEFMETTGKNFVQYEPIGVVALITPWN
ncbi:MAG: aldehyde dehydrogenase family protein, partial [Proteobacteria bacterium]